MTKPHIVWDWNGTLLNDLEVVIYAVNIALEGIGVPPIDADSYRDHYTRPVRAFYDSLLERPTTDSEWITLNDTYHEHYYASAHTARLADTAESAMDLVDESGWSQSLLSMTPQTRLESIIEKRGLMERLEPVTGLPGSTGGLKGEHLARHLDLLGLSGSDAVVVGDTPDDVRAAHFVGAHAILYDGGSHHREVLDAVGVLVVESLEEAVSTAVDG